MRDREHVPWQERARCKTLTPEQADEIFFPKAGGKSNRAKEFCHGCPVEKECLQDTLAKGGVGFWAGTTEPERNRMVAFLKLVPSQLDKVPDVIPRHKDPINIPVPVNLLGDPLFGLEGPSREEELKMYGLE